MSTSEADVPSMTEEANFESHLYASLIDALAAAEVSEDRATKGAGRGNRIRNRQGGTGKLGMSGPARSKHADPMREAVANAKRRFGHGGPRKASGTPVSPSLVRQAIRRALAETAPSFDDPVVVKIARVVERALPVARRHASEAMIEKMVDALVETHDPIARVSAEIDASNAKARVWFVSTFPTMTAEEVNAASGSRALNKHQTASRWKTSRRIFSVPWKQVERYPAFQFEHGAPRPVVARVLSHLPERMSRWEVAFWFVSTNGWLGGATPLDSLDDAERVAEAARMEGEAVIG